MVPIEFHTVKNTKNLDKHKSVNSLCKQSDFLYAGYEPIMLFLFVYTQSPVLKMAEGDTIYDYCWFPKMTSMDPDTCLWVFLSVLFQGILNQQLKAPRAVFFKTSFIFLNIMNWVHLRSFKRSFFIRLQWKYHSTFLKIKHFVFLTD